LFAIVSLLANFYFFVMIMALFFGTAMQPAVKERRWQSVGIPIMVTVSAAFFTMWGTGYFWERGEVGFREGAGLFGPPTLGYGKYSMNLLSPWVPQWSGIFPHGASFFGASEGPLGDAIIDATGGQYEGYQYLGVGVLLLASEAILLERQHVGANARRYWGLITALCVLSVLALTHRVYFGRWGLQLTENIPLILDHLRNSGRCVVTLMSFHRETQQASNCVGLSRGSSAPVNGLQVMQLDGAVTSGHYDWNRWFIAHLEECKRLADSGHLIKTSLT
jgi:hypothetical protein